MIITDKRRKRLIDETKQTKPFLTNQGMKNVKLIEFNKIDFLSAFHNRANHYLASALQLLVLHVVDFTPEGFVPLKFGR